MVDWPIVANCRSGGRTSLCCKVYLIIPAQIDDHSQRTNS